MSTRRMLRALLHRDRFPADPRALAESDLFTGWWYYSVELLPGQITTGHYPDDFPFLPRILLRNCELRGATCLDLGSMEGLIPVLMSRAGARTVLATDAVDHCREKMAAVRHYYGVDFRFMPVGLMYNLTEKLHRRKIRGFDLINVSGLLYHVFSPLMVLAGVRPLLKKNGLMIVSTNVVADDSFSMELNNGGRLQEELNTFWYVSVNALDYLLRYLKLEPIDSLYLPHKAIRSAVRYVTDVPSGYLSVVCRAREDVVAGKDDAWMSRSARTSWEYNSLIDWKVCHRQETSTIGYSGARLERGKDRVDAASPARGLCGRELSRAEKPSDAHILRLNDDS